MLVPLFAGLYQRFWGRPPVVAPEVLKRVKRERSGPALKDIRFDRILRGVSAFYAMPSEALTSSRRDAETSLARHVVCYLAYKQTGLSFPAIGRQLGNRHHTSILHGVRKIEKMLASGDENLAFAIITITRAMQ